MTAYREDHGACVPREKYEHLGDELMTLRRVVVELDGMVRRQHLKHCREGIRWRVRVVGWVAFALIAEALARALS